MNKDKNYRENDTAIYEEERTTLTSADKHKKTVIWTRECPLKRTIGQGRN